MGPILNQKQIERGIKRCRDFANLCNNTKIDNAKDIFEKDLKDYMDYNPDLKKVSFKMEKDGPLEIESTYQDGKVTKEFCEDSSQIGNESFEEIKRRILKLMGKG